MSLRSALFTVASLLLLPACGLDPAKITPHALFADDGARVVFPGAVSFAVVGNTAGDAMTASVLQDIGARAATEPRLSFVTLLGDVVSASSNGGWKDFEENFSDLLARPGVEGSALPAVPVAGGGEGKGDPTYLGLAAAFPGFGTDIGLNRVASWYAFDLVSDQTVWRIFVLDAAKERLASRWSEQLAWLDTVADGEYDGALVFFNAAPESLAGSVPTGVSAAAPTELMDTLLADIDDTKVKAVFFAEPAATQVLAPEGEYGTLHIGAGGGGSALLDVWREAPQPPKGQDPLSLESSFDSTLVAALNRWSEAATLDEKAMNMARGEGDFEGAPRRVQASLVPTWGWWEVNVNGPALSVRLHLYQPDGSFGPSWGGRTKLGEPWRTLP